MNLFKITAVLFMGAIVLSACAQQEEPEPVVVIEPEPVFDKYGNQIN